MHQIIILDIAIIFTINITINMIMVIMQDDNYIAVRDVDSGEYMMNGGFVVSMFQKSIQYSQK